MRRGFFGIVTLTFAAAMAPSVADAAMLAAPTGSLLSGRIELQQASFWARPFPSGYTGWRHCRKQRVLFETPRGPRWRRVCV